MKVTDEMVSRFLTWKLPEDFGPDCGIAFAKFHPNGTTRYEPVGTNLLTAPQARQMLEHVLAAPSTQPDKAESERYAWMIEMTAGPRPLWYTGGDILSADANEGIRFSTKERAIQVFGALRELRPRQSALNLDYDCYAFTEHAWLASHPPAEAARVPETAEPTGARLPNFHEPSYDKGRRDGSGDAAEAHTALVAWVVERWHAEVANRPLVNIHRRTLDDTWRQMLRHLDADDVALLGPTHDELLAGKEST